MRDAAAAAEIVYDSTLAPSVFSIPSMNIGDRDFMVSAAVIATRRSLSAGKS